MRYEFFLDARDYLKYGLLEDICAIPPGRNLTFVWMLTPDLERGHGNRRPRFDPDREALNRFFQREPDLPEVQNYFMDQGIMFNSYGHDRGDYVKEENRKLYFQEIPDEFLLDTVVFFDPDNGLEPDGGCSPRHVKYGDVRATWDRLRGDSFIVIYQHLPRRKPSEFWPEVADKLRSALGTTAGWVAFGDVGFLVAGSDSQVDTLSEGLSERYELTRLREFGRQ